MGENTHQKFQDSIREQLIKRYPLHEAEKDNLSTLLDKISKLLDPDERLVIVVDALDEVAEEPKPGENILSLPITLPERVYFLLTRRPFNKDLNLSPDVPLEKLDLSDSQYEQLSFADVEEYIGLYLKNGDPYYPQYKDALKKWMQKGNYTTENFVKQVAKKSENNFMYLRYVLPGIAKGEYDNLELEKFPQGLGAYYTTHWDLMGMDKEPQELMAIVLFILVQVKTSPNLKMIADIADKEEYEVEEVLNKWVEYLRKQDINGQPCYSIYHASFLDFLKGKRKLQPKRFEMVDRRISDYLY